MPKIDIEKRRIQASAEEVYQFLADMNNYQELMPESVYEWNSTADECTFKVKGISEIGMKVSDRQPHSLIVLESFGKVPLTFKLQIHVTAEGEHCDVNLNFTTDANAFMWMMVEKPLGSFFGYLSKKVQEKYAKE